jgi:TolB-like protein/DNA-binding winged helix-turn-helix (wHTH) protein
MEHEIGPKDELPADRGVLAFDGFDIDFGRGELRVGGQAAALRPKTFAVLAAMARSPARLLSKDALIHAVWPDVVVTDDSLVQCIGELRSALGDRGQRLIRTIPRRGYMLDATPRPEPAAASMAPTSPVVDSPPPPDTAPPTGRRWFAAPLVVGVAVLLLSAAGFAGWYWMRMPPAGIDAAVAARRAIAILPFADLGEEKAGYLAEAVTEDLTVDVSRIPDTLVIAQASTAAAAGRGADIRQAGRVLGANYVVTGSVRRNGQAVVIAVQLHATDSGALLWSDRFEYAGISQWNWQQDITARIANALDVRIDQAMVPANPYSGRRPDGIEATLRGWHTLRHVNARADLEQARALFEQSLKSDPDSVSALTGLAFTHIVDVARRWSNDPKAQIAVSDTAIDRALTLQPNDARAVFARSLLLTFQGRLDEAERATHRSLELHPNHPRALMRLGFLKLQQGRPAEVAAPVMLSLRLNPLEAEWVAWGHFYMGMAEFHMGHDEAAYQHMRQMTVINPQNGFAWQWMAAIDALHGRLDAARAHLAEYQKRIPGHGISSLKASEPSTNAAFWAQEDRFYEGLRKAGAPE